MEIISLILLYKNIFNFKKMMNRTINEQVKLKYVNQFVLSCIIYAKCKIKNKIKISKFCYIKKIKNNKSCVFHFIFLYFKSDIYNALANL